VLGNLVISINEIQEFFSNNPDVVTYWQGNPQIKCQILKNKKGRGVTIQIDTYKADTPKENKKTDKGDLPF
jgi:hypothetical protein